MMKLNGHFLNDHVAIGAIRKAYVAIGLPGEVAYRIGKLAVRCDKEMKKYQERSIELHKKYCKTDEKGEVLGLKEGKLEFLEEGKEKEHDDKFKEILDVEFEEKVLPIKPKDLDAVKLTPAEMMALEKILEC